MRGDFGEHSRERLDAQWLEQILMRSRRKSFLSIGFILAGDHDDFGMRQGWLLPHGATDLKTVAARHQQIADHQIRSMPTNEGQTEVAIIGFEDLPARTVEELGERRARVGFVFDEDNRFHNGLPV